MKQFILFIFLTLFVCSSVLAQDRVRVKGSAESKSQANTQVSDQPSNKSLTLDSGTQLSAELLTTLDVKKAKPGDEFKARTLKPVIAGGNQLIAKGTVLTGHVVEATKSGGKNGVSQLKLSFDQLRNKNLTMPFSATIEQITQVAINQQTGLDDVSSIDMSGSANSRARTSSGGSSGGLLGGVTGTVGNTLGGVTGSTTGVVGDTVGGLTTSTQQTVGNVVAVSSETLNSSSNTAKGLISITSNSSAEASSEASANSTLMLTGRNVKVEKGAIFSLRTDKALNIAASK